MEFISGPTSSNFFQNAQYLGGFNRRNSYGNSSTTHNSDRNMRRQRKLIDRATLAMGGKLKKRKYQQKYNKYGPTVRGPKLVKMKPEKKYLFDQVGWTNSTAEGANQKGTGASYQGTAATSRIGNKIQMLTMRIRGQINQQQTPTAGTTIAPQRSRIVLLLDRQPGGLALPAFNLIFDTSVNSPVNCSIRNEWSKRYKILKEQIFEHDGSAGETYNLDWYVNLKNRVTTSVGAGDGTYSSIMENGYIFIVMIGSDITTVVPTPLRYRFDFFSRFYDV